MTGLEDIAVGDIEYILKHSGIILGYAAAITTPIVGVCSWIFKHITDKQTDKLIEANSNSVQKLISKQLIKAIDGLDPDDYYTLDLKFPDGNFLHVPMIPNVPLSFLENVSMTVISHTKYATRLSLVCNGFGNLPEHCHELTSEEIRIEEGYMTCLKSGRRYSQGEVWKLPPGEFHGAMMHDCVAIITHRPPLMKASQRPVNILAMENIFKGSL